MKRVLSSSLTFSRPLLAISVINCLLLAFFFFEPNLVLPTVVAGIPPSIILTAPGVTYAQDFNLLASTGSSNATPDGWGFVETGTNANLNYTAGNGASNSGDTYSFGATGSAERAFGTVQSGNLNSIVGASFTNNTGGAITSLTISYTGEQWRLGTAGRVDRLDFEYSTDATNLSDGTWTGVDALDFVSPTTTGTVGALDGNAPANRTIKTFEIPNLNIANGAVIFLRWTDFNASGADDGLAIDDFSVVPNGPGGGVPTLSVSDASGAEGQNGATIFNFTVSLSQAAPAAVSFVAATADGTATVADNDYQLLSSTVFSIPAGSTTITIPILVNGDAAIEPNETFFLNISNSEGASILDGQGAGVIFNDDVSVTPINQIQGAGSASPLVGQSVTTTGIVTAVRNNGFYLQTPDANADDNANTSEGVFVFTSSAPPATVVAIGNSVQVTATVVEFVPNSDLNQRPLTELSAPVVALISASNPLPAPVTITAADASPSGGLENLEKYEGMRVRVDSLKVVAPTGGNVNETNAIATSNGAFYGVVSGIPRPTREPGVNISDSLPTGAPVNVPRFDENPERIRIASFGQIGGTAINVTTDATVSNLVGVLDYGFRSYTIFPDPAAPPVVTGNLSAVPVTDPLASEMTVASFNLERFFDSTNDPAISEPVLTPTAFANRLNKASLAIRNVLKTPDVLGVVEIENLTVLQTLAAKINSDAVSAGQTNPNYAAYLAEGNDVGGIDVGFLVKSSRITVNAVTQYGKDAVYTNPNNGQPELLNDRPPLRLQATVQLPDNSLYAFSVVVNHLRSLSGIDETDGARIRAKRRAQAEYLANLVQGFQQANPNEPVLVCGDLNAFQFNDGYVDSIGTIKGAPTPSDQVVLASLDLVNPDLINLVDTLSAPGLPPAGNQAYSFVFDGNAQVLDHILITQNLQSRLTRFEYARLGADFPETYRNDSNRPERISDHDAPIAYVSLLNERPPEKANLSGRITDSSGRPVRNSLVVLLNLNTGRLDYDLTNSTGRYNFNQIPTGNTYLIKPLDLRFRFAPSYIITTVNSNLENADFIAQSRR